MQPNIFELDNFLQKSGYRLVDILSHNRSSETPGLELVIEPIESGHLHPEIYHNYVEGNFYAKIIDHGLLISSDVEEIIKGYTTVLEVLRYLETLDMKNLEI